MPSLCMPSFATCLHSFLVATLAALSLCHFSVPTLSVTYLCYLFVSAPCTITLSHLLCHHPVPSPRVIPAPYLLAIPLCHITSSLVSTRGITSTCRVIVPSSAPSLTQPYNKARLLLINNLDNYHSPLISVPSDVAGGKMPFRK